MPAEIACAGGSESPPSSTTTLPGFLLGVLAEWLACFAFGLVAEGTSSGCAGSGCAVAAGAVVVSVAAGSGGNGDGIVMAGASAAAGGTFGCRFSHPVTSSNAISANANL